MLYVSADDEGLLRQLAIHLIAETPPQKMFEVLLESMNQNIIDPHTWATRLMKFIWGKEKTNAATLTVAANREGIKNLWIGVLGVLTLGVWEQERLDKFMKILHNMGWEPEETLLAYAKDRTNGY